MSRIGLCVLCLLSALEHSHRHHSLNFVRQAQVFKQRCLLACVLAILTITAGCFTKTTEVGPPEKVGNFVIQKFHLVRLNDTGNTESDFFEISHGRVWRVKLGLPPHNWTSFDRITRLPSKSLAWLVEAEYSAGVITEINGMPSVELLWRGEYDDEIQRLSETQWHIPDYVQIERFPEAIYSGGRLFDASSLTKRSLPNQPPGGRHRFLSLSADAAAVAWLRTECEQDKECTYSVVVSDSQGLSGEALSLGNEFLKLQPMPRNDPSGPTWQSWFDRAFKWQLSRTNRWEVRAMSRGIHQ